MKTPKKRRFWAALAAAFGIAIAVPAATAVVHLDTGPTAMITQATEATALIATPAAVPLIIASQAMDIGIVQNTQAIVDTATKSATPTTVMLMLAAFVAMGACALTRRRSGVHLGNANSQLIHGLMTRMKDAGRVVMQGSSDDAAHDDLWTAFDDQVMDDGAAWARQKVQASRASLAGAGT